MLQPKYQGKTQSTLTGIPTHLLAFQIDNSINKSSKPESITGFDTISQKSAKNLDKLDSVEQRFQQDRNVYFQSLLIGDQSVKKNKQGTYNVIKFSQNALDSKQSLVDIPNESQSLIQTMNNFNKNNQTPFKKGNGVAYKSQCILPQSFQILSNTFSTAQKEQRQLRSSSELNTEQTHIHSSNKTRMKTEPSGVSSHFYQAKKVSSQVTLKTIINLNHASFEKRSSLNSEKGIGFLPQEIQQFSQTQNQHQIYQNLSPSIKQEQNLVKNQLKGYQNSQLLQQNEYKQQQNESQIKQQPSQFNQIDQSNVIYVTDRFIDTRELMNRKIKKNLVLNGQNDSHSNNIDSSYKKNQNQSQFAENNFQQKSNIYQKNNKIRSQENLISDGETVGQIKCITSSSLKPYSPSSQRAGSSEQTSLQSLNTKTITIIKKPSSRHQPSRMKFTAISSVSQKNSLPSTPQSRDRQSTGRQQYIEDIRPQSQGSPHLNRNLKLINSQHKVQVNGQLQFKPQIKFLQQQNGQIINQHNSCDLNISNQFMGNEISFSRSNGKQKMKSQSSMVNFHNVMEPLSTVRNLNQNQQKFLSRSINLLAEIFPKGTKPLKKNDSKSFNDIGTTKRSHFDFQKSLQDIPSDPREGLQKSIKKTTFNLIDEEDEIQLGVKNSYSYLKDNPEHQNGSSQGQLKSNNLIKDFEDEFEKEEVEASDKYEQNLSEQRELCSSNKQTTSQLKNDSSRKGTKISLTRFEEKDVNLSNMTEEESQAQDKDEIKIDSNTLKKYQKGINIEKEILEQKLQKQKTYQQEVQDLISTIQNNAMENHNNGKRMERSQKFNLLRQKSKITEEMKIQKKKEFEENLQLLKEKNEYEGQELDILENDFATGGKFNQKNYNNLKISKTVKRSKQQVVEIFKKTVKLLQRLNIDPAEVMEQKIFSSRPFEKNRSNEFLECVKANNIDQVSYLLKVNKYLVYEFDYLFMTPLHWACKRGLFKMTQLLLRFNSDLEAEDMIGRTPLFFAVESNHEEVIEHLLVNKASPYKTKYVDYAATAKTYVVSKMLSACRRLHWAIKLNPNPNKAEQWKKEVSVLYTIRSQQQNLQEEERKKKELASL